MEEGDSQVSVLEFYAACLVSATLAKYESLLVPSENRALVYFSHVVFCICQILPIFHSTELFWVAKRENRGGKKHDHFLSDAPCKSIVGTSNIFQCQKRSLSDFCREFGTFLDKWDKNNNLRNTSMNLSNTFFNLL